MNTHASPGAHPKQESSDLRPRLVLAGAAGVIMMVLVVALVARLVTRSSSTPSVNPPRPSEAPSVRLSSNPVDDIAAFQQGKRSRLETFGWADREHAFAHIPIERAMRELAARNSSAEPVSDQGQQ